MDHNGGIFFFFAGDWNGLALVLSDSVPKNIKTRRATVSCLQGGGGGEKFVGIKAGTVFTNFF